MKKALITFALIAVLALGLCACGKEEPVEPESVEPVTKEVTTAAETTVPETITPETDPSVLTDEECMSIAKERIEALNTMNAVESGFLDVDDSLAYTSPEGFTYHKVTDPKFQNFGDLNEFCLENFSKNFYKSTFPTIYDPSSETVPQFLYLQEDDLPTGLYMIDGGKGYSYYDPEGYMTIRHNEEDFFQIDLDYDNFGETETLDVAFAYENGVWVIDETMVVKRP